LIAFAGYDKNVGLLLDMKKEKEYEFQFQSG
jgi:hypothetical protein